MPRAVQLVDFAPAPENVLEEVVAGLSRPRKELPAKLFYDERGSRLFERICTLPEYYPTRTETRIMRDHAPSMARLAGPRCMLIEYGSGNSEKTRILLENLQNPAAYVPIDISKEHLLASARKLATDYPALDVLPVCADYEQPFEIPVPDRPIDRRVVYFPGSTIGNFHPPEARRFLERMAARATGRAARAGALLIGVDLKKDPAVLRAAYNDAQGVTAAFNLNVLVRLNREIGTDFDPASFRHVALYNETESRVEMHLECLADHVVHVDGAEVAIARGETIWTESSYKYSVGEFAALASRAGLDVREVWTDPDHLFSVQYLTVR